MHRIRRFAVDFRRRIGEKPKSHSPGGIEHRVVREAITDENVMPPGTSLAYKQARREPPEVAKDWISPDINTGKWEGYTPPPLPGN